jgi:uncharacterized protein (TIGR02231 family)
MQQKCLSFLTGMLFFLHAIAQSDTVKTNSTLSAATIYFGHGAELTHQAKLTVYAGTRYIIINNLSTSVDVNSLQISVPENIALLSQSFSIYTPVVQKTEHPFIKKWTDSIKLIQRTITRLDNMRDIEQQVLDKTGKLIESTIEKSGNKTVSSDETLKLIAAYSNRIEKAKSAIFKLNEDKNEWQEKIAAFTNSIDSINGLPQGIVKSTGQLLLQVICERTAEVPVSLSYFTNNAGFTPLYDVRVNAKTNDVKLVYKAAVTQTTGIDWKQVKLTLSTGNPNWAGTAPLLTAWHLQEYNPQLYQHLKKQALQVNTSNSIQSISEKSMAETIAADNDNSYRLAGRAPGVQIVDPSTLQQYTTLSESQLNTNFEIDLPYNIASDGQINSVTIKEEKLEAILKNYAVPKLDKDAYLLAEIANWQNLNLLPGVANIIIDNTYLGKSFIDANSTADTLNLSLGKDRRLAIKRQVVKEYTSIKTNGNVTKQTFTYELTVKNNKTTDVDMLLKDQYPISLVKEIEVKLDDDGGAMVNEELGILTWQIKLKPGESKKFRFTYTVKYPKDKRIANL